MMRKDATNGQSTHHAPRNSFTSNAGEMEERETVDVILMGPSYAGRSSLINVFFRGQFIWPYADCDKFFDQKATVDEKQVYIGLEYVPVDDTRLFTAEIREAFRKAQGIIFVYDVTKEASLQKMLEIFNFVQERIDGWHPMVLVGNKIDAVEKTGVDLSHIGAEKAARYNIPYILTSAYMNKNVDEVFHEIVRQVRRGPPPDAENKELNSKHPEKCILA